MPLMMSFAASRHTVAELVRRARAGRPTKLLLATLWLGVVVAAFAATRTDAALQTRAAAAARQDRLVAATVSPGGVQEIGRTLVRTVALRWSDPLGIIHTAADSTPSSAPSGRQQIWVNSHGLRTAGPLSPLAVAAGIAQTVVEIMLLTGLVLAVLNRAVPGWHRRRLRAVVNAHWANLVHSYWEDV